jgi:hypothetical protein
MKHSMLARAVAVVFAALAASQASAGPPEDLSACGAIPDPTERLACYDRLAGRSAAPVPLAPKTSTAVPPLPASPASPATVAVPVSPPPAPAQTGAAARPAAPAAEAKSFGAYSAEHPTAPEVPQSLTVRVTALGKTIDGRPTMTIEGGALWLLEEKDPLLAIGDTVSISRGLLGSFLLETPTRRLHHVRRIR